MLAKNLEFINNPGLKSRLEKLTIEESRWNISYCMTETNDYLLLKDEVPVDDIKDPRGAVREMLSTTIKQSMGPNDIIVTFGLGMCYMLDEVFNAYPSRIFVYEPDIKLMHFVLSYVDISEHLKSGRVFIFDDMNDLLNKLSEIYLTKDKVELVYLKNYAVVKSQELIELTQKVFDTCKSKMVDVNTILRFSRVWLMNIIKNIKTINAGNFYKLSDLEDKFAGQIALVAAAGPSFKDNLPKIKENRNKYVIFAINRTLRTLIENGITPDFVVCLDPEGVDASFTNLEEELPKINCIIDLKSDPDVYARNFKKTFVSFTGGEAVVKRLIQFNPGLNPYECGGSTTTLALVAAVKMGFSKVIFTGLDLAFKNGEMYASGEAVEKTDDAVMIGGAAKNLTQVKSVTGEMVDSRDDYAAFIQHFAALINDLGYTEAYNTTPFGAAIEGMKNVIFENIPLDIICNTTSMILGETAEFKIQTKEWVQEELMYINNVIDLLSKEEFSPALVSTIVKSSLMYQYMQADVLKVLQSKMAEGLAEEFIENTKLGVKQVIEALQKSYLI